MRYTSRSSLAVGGDCALEAAGDVDVMQLHVGRPAGRIKLRAQGWSALLDLDADGATGLADKKVIRSGEPLGAGVAPASP